MDTIPEWLSRTEMLLGEEAIQRLLSAKVAVFGVGGVGGYAVEVLARSGVGELHLFDADTFCESNLNRQLIATRNSIGQKKVEAAAERIKLINPQCKVSAHEMFYLPEKAHLVDLSAYDYVADCVDTVSAKVELIRRCTKADVPIIVSMGAANKLDATAFRVGPLRKTQVDPLAKALRKKLRGEAIGRVKCVWSEEVPCEPLGFVQYSEPTGRPVPASNAFVPAAAGIILGGEIVKDLIRG